MTHQAKIVLRLLPVAAVLLLAAGCGKSEPPVFHLNMIAINQAQIPAEQQQELANVLEALYGTPDDPFVLPDMGLDLAKLKIAAGPVRSDQFGRAAGLYLRQRGHCQGTTGHGRGPSAMLLNTYPRD